MWSGVKQGPDVGAVWGAGMGREPEGESVASTTVGDGVGCVVSGTEGGFMKLSISFISSLSESDSELYSTI